MQNVDAMKRGQLLCNVALMGTVFAKLNTPESSVTDVLIIISRTDLVNVKFATVMALAQPQDNATPMGNATAIWAMLGTSVMNAHLNTLVIHHAKPVIVIAKGQKTKSVALMENVSAKLATILQNAMNVLKPFLEIQHPEYV